MSSHWSSGPGQPGYQAMGYQGPPGPSRSTPGPPPPLPPRPAGFGFQPLPPDRRPSAPSSQHGRESASASASTPHVSNSASYAHQVPSPVPPATDASGRTGQQQEAVDASSSSVPPRDGVDDISKGLEEMYFSNHPTERPYNDEDNRGTSSTPSADYGGSYSTPDFAPFVSPPTKTTPVSEASQSPATSHRDANINVRLQPTPECLGVPVAFPTTWYTHHLVPDYYICSYCYEEHIRPTRFQLHFKGAYLADGQPRFCSFSRVRMMDRLFKDAVAKGTLDDAINYMRSRVKIPACVGSNGLKGPNPKGRWYRAKDNQMPNLVVCQACYEDYVLAQRFAANFEVAPEQPADSTWSCDFSVLFIYEEYKRCSAVNDWPRFVDGANLRLTLPKCPGTGTVYPGGKQWFMPVKGPQGFLICSTCYCDYIASTTEQTKWRDIGKDPVSTYGASVKCCFGALNMSNAANRTLLETHNYDLFWTAVHTLATEPMCKPEGTTNATWYTLNADPDHFAICRACYVMIVQTWGAEKHFMHKPSIGKDEKLICCFSKGIPRIEVYMSKFIELALTNDPAPLTNFAIEYGAIPVCKRDNDFKNGRWFGWGDCTICPECYHHFIRGTALESSMPLQGQRLDNWRMCEMYSPRMRRLYLEACASDPPDPTALLAYSRQRREVYAHTMIPHRQNIANQEIKFLQWQNMSRQSLFYNNIGANVANTMGYTHTYGQAGVGYGFRNEWELDGARYGQQANGMAEEIRNSQFQTTTGGLLARWRQVE